VQPEAQPHLAQTTTQQQLQLSPFLITVPDLTLHRQHTTNLEAEAQFTQADLDTNVQANLDTNAQSDHETNGWRQH